MLSKRRPERRDRGRSTPVAPIAPIDLRLFECSRARKATTNTTTKRSTVKAFPPLPRARRVGGPAGATAHAGKSMAQSRSHAAGPSGMPSDPDAPRRPKPKTTPKWLDAWSDPMANVDATSELMDVADLAGDGEWRLVMCSAAERKIKVWANARLVSEQSLPDEPVAMRCFYAVQNDGGARKPSVAVAAANCVYIFRSGASSADGTSDRLRPYYKFTLPSLPVEPRETEVWRRLGNDSMAVGDAFAELAEARDAGAALTERTLAFLAIEDATTESGTDADSNSRRPGDASDRTSRARASRARTARRARRRGRPR